MVTSGGISGRRWDATEDAAVLFCVVHPDVLGLLRRLSGNISGQLPCYYGGGRNDARVGDWAIFADRISRGSCSPRRCRVGRLGGVRRLQSGLRPRPLVDGRG